MDVLTDYQHALLPAHHPSFQILLYWFESSFLCSCTSVHECTCLHWLTHHRMWMYRTADGHWIRQLETNWTKFNLVSRTFVADWFKNCFVILFFHAHWRNSYLSGILILLFCNFQTLHQGGQLTQLGTKGSWFRPQCRLTLGGVLEAGGGATTPLEHGKHHFGVQPHLLSSAPHCCTLESLWNSHRRCCADLKMASMSFLVTCQWQQSQLVH